MSREWKNVARKKWTLIVVSVFFLVIAGTVLFSETIREIYEVASVRFFPNPRQAFAYGERHFTSGDPRAYNVALAEYFFRRAQMLDPYLMYVDHELARIDFLKGKFSVALVEINLQIINHGDSTPNSYYIRALIEGFMGDYASAAKDYEHYLRFDPNNWAAINDYAWVLLKAGRARDAVVATASGLKYFPDNAWLLNSNAIGLYELGYVGAAQDQAQKAMHAINALSEKDWLLAYPGNDPKIAAEGLEAFREAALQNIHTISLATSTTKL